MKKDIQWIFTCSMQPQIFREWDNGQVGGDFTTVQIYDEDYNLKENINLSLMGSSHSKKHCGLKPISENYALFFIKNRLWKYYYLFNNISIVKGKKYVKCGDLYHRYSTNDKVYFIYEKINKKYKFIGIGLEEFTYELNKYDENFNTFDIYETYVKYFCSKHNIEYEGI